MKFEVDKKYLKVSFYVVFTFAAMYFFLVMMNNIFPIINSIKSGFDRMTSILSPAIVGLVIAYLLEPVVNMYENKVIKKLMLKREKSKIGKKKKEVKSEVKSYRTSAVAITYLTVFFVLGIFIFISTKSIGSNNMLENMDALYKNITAYVNEFNNVVSNIQQRLEGVLVLDKSKDMLQSMTGKLGEIMQYLAAKLIKIVSSAGGQIMNFVLSLVLSFYFLKDKKQFLHGLDRIIRAIFKDRHVKKLKSIWEDVDRVLSGYIRGQLTDALIMGILISITLSIIGIEFAVIIGIIAGASNLIPYFGPIVGVIFASLMGLLSGDIMKAVYALISLMILQQIDGSFIVPKVVGENVDLHPVAVLVSLVIAGALFGILGMLLAVPVAALIKLFLNKYIDSALEKKQSIEKTNE